MKHVFTLFAFALMSSGLAQEPTSLQNASTGQTSAGVFDGVDYIWLTDSDFLNFGQNSFTAHVRFRSTDLSNLNECCGYQTLIAKGAAGGSGDKGFNLDLRGEPDEARIKCNLSTGPGINVILNAPIVANEWYDLVFVVDWSNNVASLFVNGDLVDEGSLEGLGNMNNSWYPSIGRFVWDNSTTYDGAYFRGEMSWLRMIEGADYELGSDPCSERENPLFELDEFTAEEVAAQVNSVFNLDEVVSIESPCEIIVQVLGCTDPTACNFMPTATQDDGSCIACSVFEERCGQGTLWDENSQTCIVAHPSDTDFDGCVGMTDLLDLLSVFGTCVEVPWTCGDPLEYQGYNYETVQIGEQCWFAENLRNENFNDGTPINFISENSDWSQSWETASYCLPSPNGHANAGLLYNKWAAIHPAVCPTNWHISSHQEWIDFELFLGLPEELSEVWGQFRGETGRAMKSSADWDGEPSLQSGFNAVPSPPRRGIDGSFQDADVAGFWTSTSSESGAWYRALMGDEEGVTGWNDGDAGRFGFALRCIQDSE